mgnify:CR=1 FL=1
MERVLDRIGQANVVWPRIEKAALGILRRPLCKSNAYQVCKGRIDVATKELDAAFTQVNELTSGVGGTVSEENADDVPF